jgi:predicted Zn-dependent peptidase
VVDLIVKELRKMREGLVSGEELKRAKEFVQGSLLLGLESSSSRMTHLAQQHIYFGRIYSLREILRQLDKVSAADIRRLAGEIFQSAGINLTALGNNSRPELESVELRV